MLTVNNIKFTRSSLPPYMMAVYFATTQGIQNRAPYKIEVSVYIQ